MAEGEEESSGSGMSDGSQSQQMKRRNPAIHRKIRGISPAGDRRVRLVGTVSKKAGNGAIVLDDGSDGKAEVFFDNLDLIERIEKEYSVGDYILVTGLVVPRDGGSFDISGEIIRKHPKTALPQDLIKRAESLLGGN